MSPQDSQNPDGPWIKIQNPRTESLVQKKQVAFTAEDLSRLKEDVQHPGPLGEICLTDYQLKALIARLEAAEKAVEASEDCDKGILDSCEMRVLWQAWRKAAGK